MVTDQSSLNAVNEEEYMARITEATLVVTWADGGTHELLLQHAQDLTVRRVRRSRRSWRRRERDDIVVTFVQAGPSQTHVTPPQAVDVAPDGGPDWLEHVASLPREDRGAA